MAEDIVWSDVDEDELMLVDLSSTEGERDKRNSTSEISPLSHCGVGDDATAIPQVAPLRRFRPGYLWVSDLSGQAWCEQQMEYKFTQPTVVVENPTMTEGTNLHLARELAIQDKVDVCVTSSEDIWAIKLINLVSAINSFLVGAPIRREIPIFGSPFNNGVFMVGIIDEIRVDPETFDFDILEFKTRSSSSLPSKAQKETHHLQVLLYKKLFDDLVRGKVTKDTVARSLRLDLNKLFGEDIQKHVNKLSTQKQFNNLDRLLDFTFERLSSVPCISQCLIEYCYQGDKSTIAIQTVAYDDRWLEERCNHYVAYWKGDREVKGVDIEEVWKCQRCDFADDCEWRQRKGRECTMTNSVNMHKK